MIKLLESEHLRRGERRALRRILRNIGIRTRFRELQAQPKAFDRITEENPDLPCETLRNILFRK